MIIQHYTHASTHTYANTYIELKQISEISRYPFEIHYSDTGFELFKMVANYFKQL